MNHFEGPLNTSLIASKFIFVCPHDNYRGKSVLINHLLGNRCRQRWTVQAQKGRTPATPPFILYTLDAFSKIRMGKLSNTYVEGIQYGGFQKLPIPIFWCKPYSLDLNRDLFYCLALPLPFAKLGNYEV